MTSTTFSFTLSCLLALITANPSVETPSGTITGTSETVGDNELDLFFGIPYAVAPIGDLRFTAPQLLLELPSQPFEATVRASCTQFQTYLTQNETGDCLVLNVYRPSKANGSDKLPVMVYIHGGAFIVGAGYAWPGQNFVSYGGNRVIFVSINYRLGALGYYASEQLANEDPNGSNGGANGVLDIITALRWVRRNIGAFGGDPTSVSVMGHSTGGMALNLLLASEVIENEGLIKNAIVFSGANYRAWECLNTSYALRRTEAITKKVIKNTDIAHLRTLGRRAMVLKLYGSAAQKLKYMFYWRPAMDGYLLPKDISSDQYFERINQNSNVNADRILYTVVPVDTLVVEEFIGQISFVQLQEFKDFSDLREFLRNYFSSEDDLHSLWSDVYPADDYETPLLQMQAMTADACAICNTAELAQIFSQATDTSIVYFQGTDPEKRLMNNGDLSLIFREESLGTMFGTEYDEEVAIDYINFLTDFAISDGSEEVTTPNGTPLRSFGGATRCAADQCAAQDDDGASQNVLVYSGQKQENVEDFFATHRNGACGFWANVPSYERSAFCRSYLR